MKVRFTLGLVLALVLLMGIAVSAQAQSRCSEITASATEVYAGGTVNVSGTAFHGDTITITLDGVAIDSASADVYDHFSKDVTIPATTSVGAHTLSVIDDGESTFNCTYPLAVLAATQPAAAAPVAAALPATLPSTGFFLIPAGGMMAGGLGMLLFRKRRR